LTSNRLTPRFFPIKPASTRLIEIPEGPWFQPGAFAVLGLVDYVIEFSKACRIDAPGAGFGIVDRGMSLAPAKWRLGPEIARIPASTPLSWGCQDTGIGGSAAGDSIPDELINEPAGYGGRQTGGNRKEVGRGGTLRLAALAMREGCSASKASGRGRNDPEKMSVLPG
jgi:hypothetical protein